LFFSPLQVSVRETLRGRRLGKDTAMDLMAINLRGRRRRFPESGIDSPRAIAVRREKRTPELSSLRDDGERSRGSNACGMAAIELSRTGWPGPPWRHVFGTRALGKRCRH
jgi:hypothetical protein